MATKKPCSVFGSRAKIHMGRVSLEYFPAGWFALGVHLLAQIDWAVLDRSPETNVRHPCTNAHLLRGDKVPGSKDELEWSG
jgi:hypothetical protein